jgi:hypothetical protein
MMNMKEKKQKEKKQHDLVCPNCGCVDLRWVDSVETHFCGDPNCGGHGIIAEHYCPTVGERKYTTCQLPHEEKIKDPTCKACIKEKREICAK